MFAQRALRRPGIGLVGATVMADGPYAAEYPARAAGQNEELARLNAEPLAEAIVPVEVLLASSSVLSDEKMAQIRELGEMKKEGLLTYMEFEAQKQRLLS